VLLGLEIADPDARMRRRDASRAGEAIGKWRHARNRLQGVLRRDQPPDFVEVEMPERGQAQMQMAPMRRVERTAEKPDPALPAGNAFPGRRRGQGRTCPLPRTRYL
jgi:hypothetical protein